MSRKSRKTNKFSTVSKVAPRVTYRNASRRLRRDGLISNLTVGDRRLYTPARTLPTALTKNGSISNVFRYSKKPTKARPRGRAFFSFEDVRRTMVCVRRKERREVIHAKGVSGGRVRKGRRNEFSNVKCR